MDKELRYRRAEIIESTPACVHVRWTYQSTDFNYKVWGDQAVEDFYFYPNVFGTRVLSLTRKPGKEYVLSEFIVLTPQSAYPLDVLPKNMVDLINFDGGKYEVRFPGHALFNSTYPDLFHAQRSTTVVCRIRLHKDETQAAIYFHPDEAHYPLGPAQCRFVARSLPGCFPSRYIPRLGNWFNRPRRVPFWDGGSSVGVKCILRRMVPLAG